MNYREAIAYRETNKHLVKPYIIANTENGIENLPIIKPLLIAPEMYVSEIHAESTRNGFNNQKSLIKLGLINMNLKVFIVVVISPMKIYYQDLYDYLRPIRDANLN